MKFDGGEVVWFVLAAPFAIAAFYYLFYFIFNPRGDGDDLGAAALFAFCCGFLIFVGTEQGRAHQRVIDTYADAEAAYPDIEIQSMQINSPGANEEYDIVFIDGDEFCDARWKYLRDSENFVIFDADCEPVEGEIPEDVYESSGR